MGFSVLFHFRVYPRLGGNDLEPYHFTNQAITTDMPLCVCIYIYISHFVSHSICIHDNDNNNFNYFFPSCIYTYTTLGLNTNIATIGV